MERKRSARKPMRTSFQCSRRRDAMTLDGSFSRVGREGVDMDGLLSDREAAIGYRKWGRVVPGWVLLGSEESGCGRRLSRNGSFGLSAVEVGFAMVGSVAFT